jgi:short-subunit dehydrogenase
MISMNHNKTVFITGASSGIGKAAAEEFLKNGWNVVATMRSKDKGAELAAHPNCLIIELDVGRADTVTAGVAAAIERFQKIDVLVNNAGYALTGPFETMDDAAIAQQFDTNVLGLMRMTKAVLPQMRAAGGGTIINIASMGGRVTFPLYSVYHGTKFAVEGFTESLQFELAPQNIRVKLIEPGAIKTDFYSRSMAHSSADGIAEYEALLAKAMPVLNTAGANGTSPSVVAQTIVQAANDNSQKLRYPVGQNSRLLLFIHAIVPQRLYAALIRLYFRIS